MNDQALMVFTAKSRETIIREGGTSEWVLRPGIVRNLKYAVCTRNAHRAEDTGTGPAGPEPHGAGFMVGRISDVRKAGSGHGRDRYIVLFDAIAEIDVRGLWDGSRNPVRYVDVSDLRAKGVDFETLRFEPLRQPEYVESESHASVSTQALVGGLSIAQAKRGLAMQFGVSEDSIEITIKG